MNKEKQFLSEENMRDKKYRKSPFVKDFEVNIYTYYILIFLVICFYVDFLSEYIKRSGKQSRPHKK